jgi:hypothetical protein
MRLLRQRGDGSEPRFSSMLTLEAAKGIAASARIQLRHFLHDSVV